jgi:hypothetical protein
MKNIDRIKCELWKLSRLPALRDIEMTGTLGASIK